VTRGRRRCVGCEPGIVIVEVDKRDSLSPAGDCPIKMSNHCGGEGWGEGDAIRSHPLIRPLGTLSPTMKFCHVFSYRLWGRRIAVSGELDSVHVSAMTTFRCGCKPVSHPGYFPVFAIRAAPRWPHSLPATPPKNDASRNPHSSARVTTRGSMSFHGTTSLQLSQHHTCLDPSVRWTAPTPAR
jgi:hypothetical protein